MSTEVTCCYRAAGCNRVSACLDWAPDGRIAYGASSAVAIYDPEAVRVEEFLQGHSGRVNCVLWLGHPGTRSNACQALATGSADGTVIIWVLHPHEEFQAGRQAHSTPVTGLAALWGSEGCLLLATIAGDNKVSLWSCCITESSVAANWQTAKWMLDQELEAGPPLQHTLALAKLPGQPEWQLLALGGVDNAIRLYLRQRGAHFHLTSKLAGHGDWIRHLAFNPAEGPADDLDHDSGSKLWLASASQDRYIRIWALHIGEQSSHAASSKEQSSPAAMPSLARYAPRQQFRAGRALVTVALEALLVGHEDWVHSLAWQPQKPYAGGPARQRRPCLLSASMDRTMMMWRPDPATGLWLSTESVGDAGAQSLGYYTCAWSPCGAGIVAHGFTGALHLWRRSGEGRWEPQQALGGHYGVVVDLSWGLGGACLFTASEDQTVRAYSEFRGRWCEIARPQVHGHDFACLACLPSPVQHLSSEQVLYASGSEEKILRILEAPQAFLDTLALAQGQPVPQAHDGHAAVPNGGARALGAAVAALGLSNRAIYAPRSQDDEQGHSHYGIGAETYTEGPDLAPAAAPSATAEPPLEEHLAQSTLWPEIFKLYGHGNDLFCVAADPLGQLFASACKSQSAEFARIWLWDVATWTPAGQLEAHTLTVTQLAFSPDGQHLLSGSRDRSFALFRRQAEGVPFALVGRVQKAHARIIWCVAWSPDCQHFATGSRDGTVRLWLVTSIGKGSPKPIAELPPFPTGATSLAFTTPASTSFEASTGEGSTSGHFAWLAVGLESGAIEVWRCDCSHGTFGVLWHSPDHMRHCAAVRRLAWRPNLSEDARGLQKTRQLASCSNDHSIRLFNVQTI